MEIAKCERCGSKENLQGHHKIPYSLRPDLGDDPQNIEVICATCHAEEHPQLANMITIPRIRSGAIIQCAVCGTDRYISPHLVHSAKYCSRACQRVALHASLRGRKIITTDQCQDISGELRS